ncbi:MAG: S8 family serine peptidase [Nocardiopsaceae bacterium]|nr:S8 family serine peptidase [Nocardiopsaceae bacterium]
MRMNRVGARVALGVCGSVLAAQVAAAAPAAAGQQDLRYDQWGLEAIGAAAAEAPSQGAGITVAVLENGVVDTHPDLKDAVTIGTDFTGRELKPGDDGYGDPGTGLAGIIAARGHGKEHIGGVVGVAQEAEILSVRVRSDSRGSTETARELAEGIRYAVGEGARVITLPVGENAEGDDSVQQAISYADRSGVLVVAPGGDGGTEGGKAYPAAYDGVFAVGAVDADLRLADFSSRQDGIALAAPGVEVRTISADGGYTTASGTAEAAAFVAGAAALIRAEHPQLLPEQVSDALTSGAQPPVEGEGAAGYGAGVLNAADAVAAAGSTAEDIPLFDEDLAEQADDSAIPAWAPWAAGAGLAAVVLVVVAVLWRRSMADPYRLAPRGTARRKAAAAAPARRRGGARRKR